MKRALTPLALLAALSLPATAQSCPGDCNSDFQVTVDEIIQGVSIALGEAPPTCLAEFDTNSDGRVTVEELIDAINAALIGCGGLDQRAFVIATDFETGSFGTISLDEPRVVTPATSQRVVHSDAVSRLFDGLVYVVNRFFGDTIQILDPANDFATQVQCLVGEFTNPQDIAFLGQDKAYVSTGSTTELVIIDPTPSQDCSDFILGSIDLAEFADDDGIPEMGQMAIVGDRLYVVLQKLDQDDFFVPAENGSIVVIDVTTDTALEEIVLTGTNPFAQTKGIPVRDGALLVSQAGTFGVADGGIERVDLATGTPQGFFVTEADLGGDLTDFVLINDMLGYAIISLPDFSNAVVVFDPTTRMVLDTLVSDSNSISDIEINDRGQLFVADRRVTAPGVRIFNIVDNSEVTPEPINLGLPPFDILFVP